MSEQVTGMHTRYRVRTAGVDICIECSASSAVPWDEAHPAEPAELDRLPSEPA